MKKIFLVFLLSLLSFGMIACNSEYIIQDESLISVGVDDMYKVYYEIFVGSFSDSNKDEMGDLQGIINRFDYLNDGLDSSGNSLGVEGLWLMPIMPSPSYHKYDVTDYKDIDDDYGTLEDFSLLIEAANERGVDVIIDLVLNHTSNQHPWFKAAKQAIMDGDFSNEYINYYVIVTEDQKESGKIYYNLYGDYYYEGNFSSSMPELDLENESVRNEIVDIIQFWYDLGVKGFRLDAAKYIYLGETDKNVEFWNWFVSEAKKIKEDTYIVGEVWSGDSLIMPYYESFSNFDFGMSQQEGAVASVVNGLDDINWFVSYIDRYRSLVEQVNSEAILTPFISNHDMNRAAGYLSLEDYSMYCAASMYILSYGNPFIYYGEEIGMKGSRSTENTDANRRLAMLWGDRDTVTDPVGTTYDAKLQINGTVKSQLKDEDSLYNHYKKLIMLRKANPEIARGDYTVLDFDSYYSFGGFLSTYNNSTVGVFHNIGETDLVIDLSLFTDFSFSEVRGYVGADVASLEGQILTISGNTSVVLK
ncbi:MAG: alpha amylase [Tenericutes bacterium]|nr:alpha amylase [Mycoplasmatota bacterium]